MCMWSAAFLGRRPARFPETWGRLLRTVCARDWPGVRARATRGEPCVARAPRRSRAPLATPPEEWTKLSMTHVLQQLGQNQDFIICVEIGQVERGGLQGPLDACQAGQNAPSRKPRKFSGMAHDALQ